MNAIKVGEYADTKRLTIEKNGTGETSSNLKWNSLRLLHI